MTLPKVSLIIGFPRSGTSWFANILNSHPSVVYRHEPIGRLNHKIDQQLYQELKHNNGLTNDHREQLIKFLLKSNFESDRPPFFFKDHLTLQPTPKYFLWLAINKFPIFSGIFNYFFTPIINEKTMLVIKETVSSALLSSLIEGLCPNYLYFIIRHPCGVVASHLKGNKLGIMKPTSTEQKKIWYRNHSQLNYISSNSIDEATVLKTDEVEFTVLRWVVYHQILRELHHETQGKSQVIIYEELQRSCTNLIPNILSKAGLDYCQMTEEFLSTSTNKEKSKIKYFQSKDSSSEYYSVFRKSEFNPGTWKRFLTQKQIETIMDRVADEPIMEYWNEKQHALAH